jgi:hypothetical protein
MNVRKTPADVKEQNSYSKHHSGVVISAPGVDHEHELSVLPQHGPTFMTDG